MKCFLKCDGKKFKSNCEILAVDAKEKERKNVQFGCHGNGHEGSKGKGSQE